MINQDLQDIGEDLLRTAEKVMTGASVHALVNKMCAVKGMIFLIKDCKPKDQKEYESDLLKAINSLRDEIKHWTS